jgi:uncharacterized delta-60 repeat protein
MEGVVMLKRLIFLAVIILISVPAFAESVDTAWVRTYNNSPVNDDDDASAMAVDDSGYIYVTGYSTAAGNNQDYATVKYNPNGDTVWVRRYNGPGNGSDWARALTVDNSSNVYVTGRSYGSMTNYDYATIKYYPNGDTAWVRRYNGSASVNDDPHAIAADKSGYVYVTGYSMGSGTGLDYASIKYDPNGDTIWVRRYNGPANSHDYGNAIGVDGWGNAIVTGTSYDTVGQLDYVTIKYAPNGDTLWLRRYKGPDGGYDEAYALALDTAGNIYVTGYSYGNGTNPDYATIKYYPNGDTAWVRRYDGPASGFDYAKAIAVDDSGYVYVTGFSDSTNSYQDFATIKYDSSGNEVWVRRYNGPNNGTDEAMALALDKSSNVYVTGYSGGGSLGMDYATIKYYSNGDTAWVRRYNGPENDDDYGQAIAVDDSGNVYVAGYTHGSTTKEDYCTIKYVKAPSGIVDEAGSQQKPAEFTLSQNFPNPFNPSTKIEFTLAKSGFVTLQIYDVLGRKVKTLLSENLPSGYKSVIWDGKNDDGKEVASGVYFYQLRAGDYSEPRKMLLLK